jgi:tellurite resistance protein
VTTFAAGDVARTRRLEYLPISLFGAVMGLTGLSIAWRMANTLYGAPWWIANTIGDVALFVFAAVSLGYSVKLITALDAVRTEFFHPIAGNLFGTFLISLLLLPIILSHIDVRAAQGMWLVGAGGMIVFAWVIVSRWMSDRQLVAHATPAWIVPVVGLLDLPLAIPYLNLPGLHDVMILGLSVGLFFALPLFTMIFSRLLFEPPLPNALQPSLMILLAPFAVGFSSYVTTTGSMDLFAQSLYMLTLFVLAVLVGRLHQLWGCCPFRISWWAVSFPLAAAAITALRYAAAKPSWGSHIIGLALLSLATVTITALLARTVIGILKGELRAMAS